MFIKGQPLPKVTNMDASSAGAQKHILKQSADTCTVWKKGPNWQTHNQLVHQRQPGESRGRGQPLACTQRFPSFNRIQIRCHAIQCITNVIVPLIQHDIDECNFSQPQRATCSCICRKNYFLKNVKNILNCRSVYPPVLQKQDSLY